MKGCLLHIWEIYSQHVSVQRDHLQVTNTSKLQEELKTPLTHTAGHKHKSIYFEAKFILLTTIQIATPQFPTLTYKIFHILYIDYNLKLPPNSNFYGNFLHKLEYLKTKDRTLTNSLNKIPWNTKTLYSEPYCN
jgi:hypothetical protein